ncbi:Rv3654c family TadE-like protein [Nocardia arizonensis]|uniref:Rv3654c family TadE-like protein n=1 Tax=Nocardia arizonensis TaxID=1141647 RepID=UPI0009EABF51|nr:Rv3654c family TadE-like protein [Nocardia arizonensis]
MWSERGGATVLGCLALTALLSLTLMIAQIGVVAVARHRAQAAADLGALAAAGALDSGVEAGCAEGGEVVRRMSMRIRGCEVDEWDATVSVEGNVPIGLLGQRTVHAVARAGPVADDE